MIAAKKKKKTKKKLNVNKLAFSGSKILQYFLFFIIDLDISIFYEKLWFVAIEDKRLVIF